MTPRAESTEKVIEILLKNRGIKTQKQKEEFFNPPDPSQFSAKDVGINSLQLNKAVQRIKLAINNKEKIIVYGDYDVDGVCAAAILWETLKSLGADTLPYIPSRFSEGYGLNIESIKKLKDEDPSIGLIVTVDNGIVANDKVDFAKSLGVDVIITDHHQVGGTLPKAYAVVHTTQISGSAVAWFLSRFLLSNTLTFQRSNILTDHLGLAALGTVADVLPLVGHNRSIVTHGLKALKETSRVGILALCKEAGIDQRAVDTFHVGFVIAPRMNAMGRLEHAMESLRLLCTKDKNRAHTLAADLGKTNKARQEKTESIFAHIQENFEQGWSKNLPRILFVAHESYEEGIVGIVAGRLVEKHYRPAIVVSRGEKVSKASARSISGINIIDVIREVGEGLLLNAGGHPMAAGFSISTDHLEVFEERLIKHSAGILSSVYKRDIKVDCEVDFSLLSSNFYHLISKFAPFGFGNPTPTFLTRGVEVDDVRLMGKDNNHLKILLSQEEVKSIQAVGFRMGNLYSSLSPQKKVDVIYSVEENLWNGNRSLQLKLKAVQ